MMRRTPLRRFTPLRKIGRQAQRSKSRINYKKKLWDIFSAYIRQKYADESGMVSCVTCGTRKHWKEMQAGHYIPKSLGLSIYFEEKNVHPQCVGCNIFKGGNLTEYAIFLQATYGPGILIELQRQRHQFRKIRTPEYLEMIADYRSRSI